MTAEYPTREMPSAVRNMTNFTPLYSVWIPAMISDSASIRSNGERLSSAETAMKKMMNPSGWNRISGQLLWTPTMSFSAIDPAMRTTPMMETTNGIS